MEAIIAAIIAALAAAYQSIEAKKTAEDINKAENAQFAARRSAALEAFKRETFSARQQEIEQQAEVAEQAEEVVRQALNAKGIAFASAGTANVGGQAVTDVITEFTRQEIGTLSRLNLFQKFRSGQIENSIRNAATSQDLRVLSFLPGPQVVPAGFGVGDALDAAGFSLQIGAGVGNLFGTGTASIAATPQD